MLNRYLERAVVPFSSTPESALILLADGQWIPGVRVDSASYSLTISALLNAYTSMCALPGVLTDAPISTVYTSHPMRTTEHAFIQKISANKATAISACAYLIGDKPPTELAPEPIPLTLDTQVLATAEEGIMLTRTLFDRARVLESNFPVSCILETTEGVLIPGVNVEFSDWSYILCAERNALSTAATLGQLSIETIYLSCQKDTRCSPCGACRQLLAELTPDAVLWMDRGSTLTDFVLKEMSTPRALLPSLFKGSTLLNKVSDC